MTEISRVQILLEELRIRICQPFVLRCENIGATYLAANFMFHAQTKYIEINFHFVCEKVAHKESVLSTTYQLIDILTKSLSTTWFKFIPDKLNLCLRPSSIIAETSHSPCLVG